MSDRRTTLVICEEGTAWQRRLRPELPSVKLVLHHSFHTLADSATAQPRAAWLLVAREDDLTAALSATWRRATGVRRPCVEIVLPHHLACHAVWFYRAGAVSVHTDWRNWDDVVRVFQRHWSRLPVPARPPRDAIWDALPWRDAALDR